MGVEPYLVASSLEAVLAQRLVRVICPHCREEYQPENRAELSAQLGVALPEVLYRGRGCRQCQGTGFRGRSAVCELMDVTPDVRRLILAGASVADIRRAAMRQGARSLRSDGWRHVLEGRTTIEEVLRVTKDDSVGQGGTDAAFRPGSGTEG